MKQVLSLSLRTFKEIIRDPLSFIFGLGFPIVLIIIMSLIQMNIPVDLFLPERLVPGMTIFGHAFLTLFASMLVAKDRETAFLERLYTTPLKGWQFILGYILPLLPLALAQSLACYLCGLCFKLEPTIGILYGVLGGVPISIFFIALGILFGSILSLKAVGGICGALVTNLTSLLSGLFFDVTLVGKGFEIFAKCLPFIHAVELEKMLYICDFTDCLLPILVLGGYTLVSIILAILLFLRQMKKR